MFALVFGLLLLSGTALSASPGADRRAETATGGQPPFATVIGCSGSREAKEILFDLGSGEIFVIRVAGNAASQDQAHEPLTQESEPPSGRHCS